MLTSTMKLLMDAHLAFDELGYHPTSDDFDYAKLYPAAVRTINHTETLEDSVEAAKMLMLLNKKAKKIVKKAIQYSHIWDSLPYNGNEVLSLVSDEDANFVFHISNAYFLDAKQVCISSQTFNQDNFIALDYKDGLFSWDSEDPENNFFIRYSRISSKKMVLLNKKLEKVATIVLNRDFSISLENNETDYEIMMIDNITCIFTKKYLESLDKDKEPDIYEAVGIYGASLVDVNYYFGLAKLIILNQCNDPFLPFLFAAANILLFDSFFKENAALTYYFLRPKIGHLSVALYRR